MSIRVLADRRAPAPAGRASATACLLGGALLGGLALAQPLSLAFAADPVDEYVQAIVHGLPAESVACPEDLSPPSAAEAVRCASFDGAFSRFLRRLEKQFQKAPDPLRVEPETMWTHGPGGFQRTYRTGAASLQVQFLEDPEIAVFRYEVAAPGPSGAEAVPDPSVGAKETEPTVYVAGSDGVTYPTLMQGTKVQPKYPPKAKKKGLSDRVILRILVRRNGTVGDIDVERPPKNTGFGFEEAAAEAVGQWRYEPATLEGRAVAVHFHVVIDFKLR